ncbi:hypothetical protein PTE30175_05103 [Pandoraea terrae]|uniref:Uncharacterized protein n=1 Tax=Pandoraea terrae TaxID=1537710 RepID=A0A5E4ZBF3_9BURK|nr:hypothetical protein [Pandoraea terrae]VVE57483.1 hypothetical protein PTE30175_05103 [Pandoraea terrae]
MKRSLWWLCTGAAVTAPWLGIWLTTKPTRIDWTCRAPIEISTRVSGDTVIRGYGVMVTDYHADGTGLTRFAGDLQRENGTTPPERTQVHRGTAFHYHALGAAVRVVTDSTSRMMNDTSDTALATRYLYPGFEVGHADYFQLSQLSPSAVALTLNGMPRVYCARAAN